MPVSLEYLSAEKDAIIALTKEMPVHSQPSNEALSIQRAAMAIVDRFSLFLDKIVGRFKAPVLALQDFKPAPVSAQFREVIDLEKALGNTAYIDLISQRVQVIPGLSTTWLELLQTWNTPVNFSVNFYDDYLNPFEKFLSVAVTSPEKFTTVGSVNRITQLDIDSHVAALTACLKGNVKTNLRAYGECSERNGDTIDAYRQTLTYARSLHKGNLDLVKGSVDSCGDLLAQLAKQIKDSNLPYRLNAKTVNDLTELVFQMAKMAELYAATFTYVESQKVAMDEAAKKLIQISK